MTENVLDIPIASHGAIEVVIIFPFAEEERKLQLIGQVVAHLNACIENLFKDYIWYYQSPRLRVAYHDGKRFFTLTFISF